MARGFASFLTKSARDEAPIAFSLVSSVEDDAFVAAADQPANHVRTHPPQSDHSKLHS